jgi:hypothetical protein
MDQIGAGAKITLAVPKSSCVPFQTDNATKKRKIICFSGTSRALKGKTPSGAEILIAERF